MSWKDDLQRSLVEGFPIGGNPDINRAIGHLMNLPLSAAGIAMGLSKGAKFRLDPETRTLIGDIEGQDLGFAPGTGDPALGRALGDVVLMRKELRQDDPESYAETFAHETGHAQQGRALGPLLPIANLGASGIALARGLDPYYENPFEKAAEERTKSLRRALSLRR